MTTAAVYIACGLIAYLAGAVPFGLLIARAAGVDIRRAGSGNTGATNVFRCVGKGWGILTFACDAMKGCLPVLLLPPAAARLTGIPYGDGLAVACGCMAVVGHNWPVYAGFKGGKGVATSAGVLLGIAPLAMGIGIAAWLLVFLIGRYVSLASMAAAAGLATASWFMYYARGPAIPSALTFLAALTMWRHKANIRRLLQGTENRFGPRRRGRNDNT